MKKQIDYAAVCFGTLFLVAVVAITITAAKWSLDALGIHLTGFQGVLVAAVIWCVVVGIMIYFSMRKVKVK